jgi:hypothetical protein
MNKLAQIQLKELVIVDVISHIHYTLPILTPKSANYNAILVVKRVLRQGRNFVPSVLLQLSKGTIIYV